MDNIAQDALNADRRAKAVQLRARGAHWSDIAAKCGYPNPAAALKDVGAAMAAATMRADMTADHYRDEANLRLENLLGETLKMLDQDAPERYDNDGNPVFEDDRAVKLRAVDEARRLVESITKLNGVATPAKDADDAADTGIRIVFENVAPDA